MCRTSVVVGLFVALVAQVATAATWWPWNGHEYTLVTTQRGWQTAEDYAADILSVDPDGQYVNEPAYLVCINSADEEAFLQIQFGLAAHGCWIGGYQDPNAPDYSEPAGGWRWVSGEPFGPYTNWNAGEPNNQGSEDFITWGYDGTRSWWNDQYDGPRISIVERGPAPPPACDLCHAGNDCDYTCLNVDNMAIVPTTAQPDQTVAVDLDYEISGTPGHIIYVGLAIGELCAGEFYSGVPGQAGATGHGQVTFGAPTTAGQYPLFVAVAHVYNYEELCQAIAEGEADLLPIGTLTVTCPSFTEEFPGPALAGWQPIGNGQWAWNSEGGGLAKQTYEADDDLTVIKKLDESFGDFELTVRWRQDSGPEVSSGMSVLFRMGDTPGPGADVPGIGPHYSVGWVRTWAHYGSPDFFLSYAEGYHQAASNVYYPVGGQVIASATLNENGNWFELGQWRRTRVRAVGPNLWVYVDYDSSNPALDVDADFVPVLYGVDTRRGAGRVALNDHYAKSSWDYVHVDRTCGVGDLNCDGYVDFADINPFVLYLSNNAGWLNTFPGCDAQNGDINGDGSYGDPPDFGDINPFVALLTGM